MSSLPVSLAKSCFTYTAQALAAATDVNKVQSVEMRQTGREDYVQRVWLGQHSIARRGNFRCSTSRVHARIILVLCTRGLATAKESEHGP